MWRVCKVAFWVIAFLVVMLMMVSIDHRPTIRSSARRVAAKVQIQKLIVALERYRSDVGAFPDAAEGLAALAVNPGITAWRGPYLTTPVSQDPWGNAYLYRYRGDQVPEIVSFGADGKEDGQGPNADISSFTLSTLKESRGAK